MKNQTFVREINIEDKNEPLEKLKILESEKKLLQEKVESLALKLNSIKVEMDLSDKSYRQLRQRIMELKNSKLWKIISLFKRFQVEFLNGGLNGKKRFLRWLMFKLTGRPRTGHAPLNTFDVLPIHDLPQSQAINDSFLAGNFPALVKPRAKLHIFMFASLPYDDIGGGQRSAQFTKTFIAQGYDVTYIYTFSKAESKNVSVDIPLTEHFNINDVNEKLILSLIRGRPIFIFEIPHEEFAPYLKLAKRIRAQVIYDHIDNWETSLGRAFFSQEIFNEFLVQADLLIASAKYLVKQINEKVRNKQVKYLPNAYDESLFEPGRPYERPGDMPAGGKFFLYIGSLWGEWFLWEWLAKTAQKFPKYNFVLIGDYWEKKALPENIIFLGLKAQKELPSYLAFCDGAFVPFKPGPIVDAVSPIKVFEYLGMYKPVISTNMPETKGYPGVYQAENLAEWLSLFAQKLDVPDKINGFNLGNTWNNRCENLINLIGKPKISIIILCHDNVDIIGRCIDSLLKFNSYNYEIIVVDNQSKDGTVKFLEEKYNARIKILLNNKNGCASGRNLGFRNAEGEIIVFLDSDQWATNTRWLKPALDVLSLDRHVGAVSWSAGWFEPGRIVGPTADSLPNRGALGFNSALNYRCDVTYIGTGGMVVPRYIWEQTNGFDEAYDPTCFEDTDLSLQIKFLGYKVAYCPFIGLGHLPNQTTESGSSKYREIFKRNGDYFYNKWRTKAPKLLEVYLNE
ncbi:MAG: glycosyltransferase [Eubacteriales bacterium]|jgi:GT2 family glycosyltransferase